uniref:T-cell surface glycoprotein CD4 isoform X1 n=1 Tax=Myodes glareolus TaxID=447135 RepID=UPI00202237BC|nr:T-cell surface glycoprotein CD4 isoform X1 [Myodes glareolus]XP_048300159.1 T-cell surface glycoprotein CD4 isoform X1 [Myodes glareolus]
MYQGVSFRHLLLVLQLAQLPAILQGKTVVVGREGDTADLPCKSSQEKSMFFIWKLSDQTRILGNQNNFVTRAQSERFSRFDSKKSSWDKGSFPLLINKLKIEDSGIYICEVENRKIEVELLVFRVTVSPGTHLLQGQSLTLTLESSPKVNDLSIECTCPRKRNFKSPKAITVPNLSIQDDGTWQCTVTVNKQKDTLSIKIFVLGFKEASTTVFKNDGELVEFSFPLNLGDENLQGELRWKAEKAPSPQPWITFSLENRKVSLQKTTGNLKLQLAETLPLHLKIPQVSLENAGSGNLTLTLAKGTLHQEVNLVVMKLAMKDNALICEVRGPTSPKMQLTLKKENQVDRVTKEKVFQVSSPEAGQWECLLNEGNNVKTSSNIQVLSRGLNQNQPMFLAVVLGGTFSFLAFIGLCILCCIKCRHQQLLPLPPPRGTSLLEDWDPHNSSPCPWAAPGRTDVSDQEAPE